MKLITLTIFFLLTIQSTIGQDVVQEERLKFFLEKNPHYKENIHKYHFYDFNPITGSTGSREAKIQVFAKELVLDYELSVKYKNIEKAKVLYLLFPIISNLNLIDNRSNILYIISTDQGLMTVKASECKLL